MPDGTVYGQGSQRVVYEAKDPTSGRAFGCRGTLEEWKAEVAALCEGNSRLILAVCAALAGPTLRLLDEESGGFHIRGSSSTGKTTALAVAASVFGAPSKLQRTWRTTSNGLEGAAAQHSDTVILLDELSQSTGREAGQVVYMLGNGQGKGRATIDGGARSVAQWRLMVLSTGETSLADHLAADGGKVMAGQETRFIDVSADAGSGHQLFDVLHGESGGRELSVRAKSAASAHFGSAGRAFIKVLADPELRGSVLEQIRESIDRFEQAYLPDGAESQVCRVAHKFALVAAVGETCTALAILPWTAGQAMWGVSRCLQSWLDSRGDAGNLEANLAISQVRYHLATYGNLNYQLLLGGTPDERNVIRTQCWGYRRVTDGGQVQYLIPPESFRRNVCAGLDHRAVLATLSDAGFLLLDKNGKASRQLRVEGTQQRFFIVTSNLFSDPIEESIESPAEHGSPGRRAPAGTSSIGAQYGV